MADGVRFVTPVRTTHKSGILAFLRPLYAAFPDHFEHELNACNIARNVIELASLIREVGDEPVHVMILEMMERFVEYHSKESGKCVQEPTITTSTRAQRPGR